MYSQIIWPKNITKYAKTCCNFYQKNKEKNCEKGGGVQKWLRPFSLLNFSLFPLHCWFFIVGIFIVAFSLSNFHCRNFHCQIFIVAIFIVNFSLSNFHCCHFHCWIFTVKFSLLPFSLSNFHCWIFSLLNFHCWNFFHCRVFTVTSQMMTNHFRLICKYPDVRTQVPGCKSGDKCPCVDAVGKSWASIRLG